MRSQLVNPGTHENYNQQTLPALAMSSDDARLPFALNESDRAEALAFLSKRPIQNVIMAGWIYDRGVVSLAHRGVFYGCRNAEGDLDSVALIGHTTMFDAATSEVIGSFGKIARETADVRAVFGEHSLLEAFWKQYADGKTQPRLIYTELLFEFHEPFGSDQQDGLRKASLADLDQIVAAHAEMVFEETGTNPLRADAAGFRRRCAERVVTDRVWVYMDGDDLAFKTDIVTATPQAVYFEGVWVNPRFRRLGVAKRCLSALSRRLLLRAPIGCFFVNESNRRALELYKNLDLQPLQSVTKYII